MTKTAILSMSRPSQLFTRENYKEEYRRYAKINHPDVGGDATVMAQINKLYGMACLLDGAGGWDALDIIKINGADYHYDSANIFELGTIYVNDTKIIYHIQAKHAKVLVKFPTKVKDSKMRDQMIIPASSPKGWSDPSTGDIYYIIDKSKGTYLLKDILKKRLIEERHAAWIISRLFNICSLIQYNGLVHLDVSANTILVDPETHWVGLYGGWWYCYSENERITKLPASTYKVLPFSSISSKEALFSHMNLQIRAIAREMLGARYGDNLAFSKANSKFVEYITGSGGDSVIDDFIHWDTEVVDYIFGPRKFIKWELKKEEVYG